uniref:Protein strawberry notch homolog 2 n=1 Tax=Salarias fasciatus TaxID=181472 RepID=A0A672I452_SALFA
MRLWEFLLHMTWMPTLWDVNTSTTTTPAQSQLQVSGKHSHTPPSSEMLLTVSAQRTQSPPEEEEEAEEEETEELGHVDTYAEYRPSKSTIGINHPDIVVETNTLSSVPPPDITYTLSIPESTINSGLLSALQLEAIIYACQQHEVILQNNQRAGFLIGDGAGVGKGRTVAGIILENYLKGRKKSLWFSISNDLKFDAERDLKDIDAPNIPVHALNKIKYGDTATSEGVLFATYSALIGESQAGGQHRTRIKQILDWCKPDFDGVIIFDECHKAKNATSTKMGKAVLDLQNKLPRARVVYASATGASEPKNMIYMSRLGIWGEGTPFRAFDDFLHAIEKRGVGAMEIVAMDMKVSGMYIARQLSFSGVSFRIEEIGLDSDFKLVYNKAATLWAEALRLFMRAADELGLVSRKSLWGQFWSSHQRFFKYLCIAAKVRCLVELAQKELQAGKCIVIGLQSTGESRTREVLDENDGHLDRFVSAAEGVFQSLVTKHFPSEKQRREKAPGNKRKRKPRGRQTKVPKHTVDSSGAITITDDSSSDSDGMDTDSNSSPDSLLDNDDVIFVNHTSFQTDNGMTFHLAARIEEMKQTLLNKISELGKELPLNTLDELIDKFGGPDKVSEMTGRKGRVVRRLDGSVRYESRAEQGLTIDHINIKEKDRFMSGEKLVAIISEAASSGISLQADKRVKNQRRRVHMTLELPWSADRAIQQFGRTHRSNQVTAPEYIFLISELAGERRFASIVAKRLESLGALTHGDRRATESRDLSKYNFENKYGTKALDKITKAILGHIENKVPPPKSYPGGEAMFFREMKNGMIDVGIFCRESRFGISTEKDCSITKFLNRILGLEVHKQNHLFQYFTDNFDYLIEKDKKEGKYDMGILDLAPGNDEIYEEKQETFLTVGNPQDGQVVLYKISVDRGMPWDEAYNRSLKATGPDEGFYLSQKVRNHPCVLLAEQGRGKNFIVYKPNIGKQTHPESLDNLHQRYRKVTPEEARDSWEAQFNFSFKKCSHANWNGKCKKIEEGQECLQGMRLRQYHMLCGALLRVWKRVSDVVSDITNTSILQIVRLKTKQHNKQVGQYIRTNLQHTHGFHFIDGDGLFNDNEMYQIKSYFLTSLILCNCFDTSEN